VSRFGASVDAVGAKRVVIDTIETSFGAFKNTATLRSELRRLFLWLKARGATAVITGERRGGTLTRHGIEEYVSNCVIVRANLERERQSVEAKVAVLWREFEDEADAVNRLLSRRTTGREEGAEQRPEQGRLRRSDPLVHEGRSNGADPQQVTR
jgi:KaiC